MPKPKRRNHREILLEQLWADVLDDDAEWTNDDPGDDPVERSIQIILAAGVAGEHITRIVRQFQIDTLFNISQLLEGAYEVLGPEAAEQVDWRMFEVDPKTKKPGRVLDDFHAGFHGRDPTGREGQPLPFGKRPAKRAKKR